MKPLFSLESESLEKYFDLPEEFIVTDGDGIGNDIRELRRYIKDEDLLYTAIGQITKTLYRHPLEHHLKYRDTFCKEFSYEEVFNHSKYHPSEEDYREILSILNSIYNTLILTINSYGLVMEDIPVIKGIKMSTDIPYHISTITSSSITLEKLNIWDCK